jgi:serine/threonine protein kinase
MLMGNGELKITDFGLCRVQQTAGRAYSFTQPSQAYRAPELLFNCKHYKGTAVDMWAIGCIFAELMRTLYCTTGAVLRSSGFWPTRLQIDLRCALGPQQLLHVHYRCMPPILSAVLVSCKH